MKSKQNGNIIIIVLLVLSSIVVISTAFFVYSKYMGSGGGHTSTANQAPTAVEDRETQAIENVSSTDDVSSIQKDLDNTNFSTLDQDVLGVKTAADGL